MIRKTYHYPCLWWYRCCSNEKCPYPYKQPNLKQTLYNYKRTISPLVSKTQYENTLIIIKDFIKQCGNNTILTEKLNKIINEKENWLYDMQLSEYLSNNESYLKRRVGVVFPRMHFSGQEDVLTHAAQWIYSLTYFYQQLENMPKPKSEAFKNLFGENIEPKQDSDVLININKNKLPSNHIIIAYNNYFYKMNVINKRGELLDKLQIYKFLEMITKKCFLPEKKIGIFTSDNRLEWRKVYSKLIEDKINLLHLKELRHGLFLIALDSTPMTSEGWVNEAMRLILFGDGTDSCLANRWFDSTFQLIINSNGIIGMNLTPMVNFASVPLLYNNMMDDIRERGMLSKTRPASDFIPLTRLDINVNNLIQNLEASIDRTKTICSEFDTEFLIYDKFPFKMFYEKKLNPDCFYTLLFHYAYFKLHKEIPSHFDFLSNFLYLGETRVFSPEATNFCNQMVDDLSSNQEKYNALREACEAFEFNRQMTICGNSPDRHLNALYSLSSDKNNLHDLFKDPVFKKSRIYKLTTLKLETSRNIFCVSPPLSPSGYCCWFTITGKYVIVTISSNVFCENTNTKNYKQALYDSFDEINNIFDVIVS